MSKKKEFYVSEAYKKGHSGIGHQIILIHTGKPKNAADFLHLNGPFTNRDAERLATFLRNTRTQRNVVRLSLAFCDSLSKKQLAFCRAKNDLESEFSPLYELGFDWDDFTLEIFQKVFNRSADIRGEDEEFKVGDTSFFYDCPNLALIHDANDFARLNNFPTSTGK